LNPTRVQLASQRYNAIKQVIEQELPGKTVTQIGSFQRKTKIRPLDMSDKLDIDLLVKFKTVTSLWSEFFGLWGTPGGTLKEIQKVLIADQTYRIMRPKPDAPTVLLTYADQFTFEIVPALVDKTGRYNGSWPLSILVAKSKPRSQAACFITSLKAEVRVCSGASPRSQLIN
jgi:hypothetical protein